MKILIISPGVFPVPAIRGGAVEYLIETLISDYKLCNKHEVTLYTIYDKENIGKKYLCNIRFIKTKNIFFRLGRIIRHCINMISSNYIGNEYIYKVVKDIKKSKIEYDIIIVENQPEYGPILKKEKIKGKIVLHLHNDYLNINIKNAIEIKNSYDAILSISNLINEQVKKINSIKTKEIVLYNGVDINKFCNSRDTRKLRKNSNISVNDFVFMYSGRLVKEKGVKELIEAFNRIDRIKYNTKMLIIGRVTDKKYYNELLDISNNNNDILFYKNVSYSKIQDYYSIANVGVIPSKCLEAFGLVVIEFFASSCPVIISNDGAMKELVNISGNNAIVVDSKKDFVLGLQKAMELFLNMNSKEYNNCCTNAYKNSKFFTKENYLNNFLEIIERL